VIVAQRQEWDGGSPTCDMKQDRGLHAIDEQQVDGRGPGQVLSNRAPC
jgi:hypothetical protein